MEIRTRWNKKADVLTKNIFWGEKILSKVFLTLVFCIMTSQTDGQGNYMFDVHYYREYKNNRISWIATEKIKIPP